MGAMTFAGRIVAGIVAAAVVGALLFVDTLTSKICIHGGNLDRLHRHYMCMAVPFLQLDGLRFNTVKQLMAKLVVLSFPTSAPGLHRTRQAHTPSHFCLLLV